MNNDTKHVPYDEITANVHTPTHYAFFDREAIDIIKAILTEEEFRGYCIGNGLKYRLRAGKKDNTFQDIQKAEKYEEFFRFK